MVSEVIIPVLDQTGDEVTITQWLKNEGDEVQEGEVLCEVEASKANVEIETRANGVLRCILIETGAAIPPLTVIALIADAGEALPDVDPYYRVQQSRSRSQTSVPERTTARQVPKKASPSRHSSQQRLIASPRAKRLAAEHKIDLSTLHGTGTGGRIVEDDVRQAIEQAGSRSPSD